jgi:hypothetical protein
MLDHTQSSEGSNGMKTSIWTRIAITALAGCVVAGLAAPAWGQGGDITLRRDGSQAVPFVADVSGKTDASNAPVLRRDGSQAVPFVADVGPQTAPVAAADGFDWRDAAIGAGLGAMAVLLAAAGVVALRDRRPLRGGRRLEQA